MPGSSDFLPFGIGAGAYVLTNSDYSALPARGSGFGAGILPKERLNKAIRQSSVMASAIGGFIAQAGFAANDDGNVPALTAAFIAALGGSAGAVKVTDFTSAQLLNLDGFQKFPGGLILQWVHTLIDGLSFTTLSWPVVFPNLCFGAVISPETNVMPGTPPTIRSKSQIGAIVDCQNANDAPYCFVVALGF